MEQQRQKMIHEQISARGITDPRVLRAMQKVERHLFVPKDVRYSAYEDHPLAIGYGQTISQPFIVAYMTSLLDLKPTDRILEIGTGSGYQAAILAELVDEVYTIEIVKELAQEAAQTLKKLGYKNVHGKHGDGFQGWPEFAPFDAVIVTAAPKELPDGLIEQLKLEGRMVVPMGFTEQDLYIITKNEKGFNKEKLLPVRFVPMVKENEKYDPFKN